MNPYRYRAVLTFIILWLLPTLACSNSMAITATPGGAYRYDNLPDKTQSNSAIAEYNAIARWDKLDITYYFIDGTDRLSGDREQDLIKAAFDLWAQQTPLSFAEVNDSRQADILIGWASGEHGDGDPFDGPGDVLAHASYPNPYDERQVILHFDDDERWVDSDTQNVDLLTVAAHEIGHNLGLDHSNDPNSIMYPAYSEPHRFLGADDVAGIQSLYGLANEPAERPEVPGGNETPPPSNDKDSDGDGIADADEVLQTGTDPNKEDTDGDGLGDGVEVINRMNPLDPDMDKDGISDGQEVANGTDPFFPDQADIPPQLEEEVSDFLTNAIELEIEAYQQGDASIADSVMAGDVLPKLEAFIDDLNQRGLVQISKIDYYESYIDDIRVVNESHIEVDTCEVWSNGVYRRSDGSLVQSDGPTLLPQTITIEKLNPGWFITHVDFFDAPAFCS